MKYIAIALLSVASCACLAAESGAQMLQLTSGRAISYAGTFEQFVKAAAAELKTGWRNPKLVIKTDRNLKISLTVVAFKLLQETNFKGVIGIDVMPADPMGAD